MDMIKSVPRCVVTGNKNGQSIIISDNIVTNVSEPIPNLLISDVWLTDTMPVDLNKSVTNENTAIPQVPKNGSFFRYVQIPPDSEILPHIPEEFLMQNKNAPHPLMHKTSSLDYIVILSGEVYLMVDNEETLLKAGDIVIQRATNHAWSNRSNKPCIQLAILLDAAPE